MTLDQLSEYHPLRAYVKEVLDAASKAANLTRQLLAFSRRQPGRTEVMFLNELVAGLQNMLGRLIGEDVNLTVSLDPGAGAICANAGHLEQVIMNLVVNARDAMPNGGQLIIETAHNIVDEHLAELNVDLAPGEYVALTVSDTGTGMPPEVRAHMFDPFFTTKAAGKGTGLGLSTVYGIVKQSGGSILVDSKLGCGTKLTVLLPAVEAQRSEASARPAVSMPKGTETILLTEDEDGVRRFIRTNLEQYGYRVLECSTGLEAIQKARQHPAPIHLLLSDMVMPGMSGSELAAQFAICRPGVPVLYLSGYSDSIGPENCLKKPFTLSALLTHVRGVLDREQVLLPI